MAPPLGVSDWAESLSLPPRPILDSIGLRVLLTWGFLRAVLVVALLFAPPIPGPATDPVGGSILLSVGIALLVIPVLWVDMQRRSELLFLANLGRPFRAIAALAFFEAALLEFLLGIVVG